MSNYYDNLTLTKDNRFKNNNNTLSFGLNEVQSIYEHINSPVRELNELTGLSEATIYRIIQTIKGGGFNDFLNTESFSDEIPEKCSNVNINDIYINIYNAPELNVEERRKVNVARLKEWSKKIRERGKHICAKCGKTDKIHNQAHHIFPKSRYPSLACDEGNGIVLCQKCHADYHKQYLGVESVYNFIGWLNE